MSGIAHPDETPSIPEWASAMEAGHWYRISGNAPDLGLRPTPPGTRYLEDNDPARDANLNRPGDLKERVRRKLGRDWAAPWGGRAGFSAITEAWNGAVCASGYGRSGAMVVFGGGHDDYYGSDVHAFDLECRQWRRLSDGFVSGSSDDYGQGATYPSSTYPDGSPLPPHTYGYVQYDEVGNDLLLAKGQTELGPDVKAVAIPHLFNLETLNWRHGPRQQSAILNSGGCSTWDPKRRVLWVHSGDDGHGNTFTAYTPDGVNADKTVGRWSPVLPSKFPGEANHNVMQYHPELDRIFVALHRRDALATLDPSDPAAPIEFCVSSGAKPAFHEYAALEYAPNLKFLVYFSPVDGGRVYAANCRGRVRWHMLSEPTSNDPIADAAAQSRHYVNQQHTFGRFRIAGFAGADIAILVRHVDSPVYAMRLPG